MAEPSRSLAKSELYFGHPISTVVQCERGPLQKRLRKLRQLPAVLAVAGLLNLASRSAYCSQIPSPTTRHSEVAKADLSLLLRSAQIERDAGWRHRYSPPALNPSKGQTHRPSPLPTNPAPPQFEPGS